MSLPIIIFILMISSQTVIMVFYGHVNNMAKLADKFTASLCILMAGIHQKCMSTSFLSI